METSHILLVDDDRNYLYLLGVILESKDLEVSKAVNGFEALELLRTARFDLIITDYRMPRMNGIELAAKAKELHPTIPIIMITCEVMPDIVELAAEVGISRLLSKPVKIGSLLADIRYFSSRKSSARP